MYTENKCTVRTAFGETPIYSYNNGLRQGCPLSPTLFNIFINSLALLLNKEGVGVTPSVLDRDLKFLLFADDLVIFGDSRDSLSHNIKLTQTWLQDWGMAVGISKCGAWSTSNEEH